MIFITIHKTDVRFQMPSVSTGFAPENVDNVDNFVHNSNIRPFRVAFKCGKTGFSFENLFLRNRRFSN